MMQVARRALSSDAVSFYRFDVHYFTWNTVHCVERSISLHLTVVGLAQASIGSDDLPRGKL